MSVKILGGLARGFNLVTPKVITTRPTSVLIRRKLFDWRQNLEGYVFVDLFAGSGAVGFEALSRGADRVILNDQFRGAWQTLKQNQEAFLKAFRMGPERLEIFNLDAGSWLNRELRRVAGPDTIIFLDPPYEKHTAYFETLNSLKDQAYAGEVWVESDRLKGPAVSQIAGVFQTVIKQIEQGDHFVVIGKLI
jgi:16S rRNA (guanine966-N2)-methyltransferase